jgi:gamma-glutamylcyclotransferase (GGCT)/AIG2-like uncharacterized protein YtfP
VGAFELRNWQLELYCHATIEPCHGSSVHGVMWELTDQCEQSLDMFEGVPSYYTKRTWYQDGEWFFFYEMASPKSGTPGEGYIHGMVEGYQQWQLPPLQLREALDRSHNSKRGYTVEIKNISATDAVDLKNQIVSYYDLVDGQDFTWSWFPEVLDEYSYFQTEPQRMEIRFVELSDATFFQLKFAHASR